MNYNVNDFTDEELLGLLDIHHSPTDRELEAKIIFFIEKYRNMDSEDARPMEKFFEDIHNRFFDTVEIDQVEKEDDDMVVQEGFTTAMQSTTALVTTSNAGKNDSLKPNILNDAVSVKTVEVKLDNQNPLLKQTIKRVIHIHSAYRENKNLLSTDFTFMLSEPIRNVLSIKLYSVNIPYTWYTISNTFGSNFFYIKGNVEGINKGKHDYKVEIPAGNYNTTDLISKVNSSLQTLNTTYSDVSFGQSGITYNSTNALSTLTVDINNQYSETSYYLQFNKNNWLSNTSDASRIYSIPNYLGFDYNDAFYPYKKKSHTFTYNLDNFNNIRKYILTGTNNYFTVYKYISTSQYSRNSIIDISFRIFFSLTTGTSYTINDLLNDINNQIQKNVYLNSTYSYLQLVNSSASSSYVGKSYFELSLKTNRYTTNNTPYSRLAVVFPYENDNFPIWTGTKSCFKFNYTIINTVSSIISDTYPIQETKNYIITTNPYIRLQCIKPYFNVSTNDYIFNIPNTNTGYNITDYISQINTSIGNVNDGTINSQNQNGDFYLPLMYADNSSNYFTLLFDLQKSINTSNFIMDLSGSFFSLMNTTYDLSSNAVVTVSIPYSQNYSIPKNTLIASFYADTSYSNIKVNHDLSYAVYTSSSSDNIVSYSQLSTFILNTFKSYTDQDGYPIFQYTDISYSVTSDYKTIDLTLNMNIQKYLTQNDYSVRFYDTATADQNSFVLDNSSGSFLTDLGLESTMFYLNNNNIFTRRTSIKGNYALHGNVYFTIDATSYVNIQNTSLDPIYNYVITPPDGSYSNTDIIKMQNDINSQFNLHPDLKGTNVSFSSENTDVGTLLTVTLTVVINQNFTLNVANSTWHNNLFIDASMILGGYDLSNTNTALSVKISNSCLGIRSTLPFKYENSIIITPQNNTFQIVPYEDGVYTSTGSNTITITIPYDTNTGKTQYTLTNLLSEINKQFSQIPETQYSTVNLVTFDNNVQYISFDLIINKVYTGKDYYISFYNEVDFIKCYQGDSTVVNLTWDMTLGWILGYRETTIYDLKSYQQTAGNTMIVLTSDTCINLFLYNNFLICLDDYNLNRINDGVITITKPNSVVSLPSYINRTNYVCDPVTGRKTYDTSTRNQNNSLTNKQIYSVTELINSTTVTNNISISEPLLKDVFGIVPLKLNGLTPSQNYSEFGGTLQNQERSYFGPVNIFKMSVKLLSDKGTLVDLNGQDWSFGLLVEQIYKKETTSTK